MRQDAIELLKTEYSEVGEEIRYRDKIIHQSYYLLIIIFGVFAQATLSFASNNKLLASSIIAFFAGGSFMFLAFTIYTYNERRLEAMILRFEIAETIESITSNYFRIQSILYPDLPHHRYKMLELDSSGGNSPRDWILNRVEIMSIGPRFISHVIAVGACGWFTVSASIFAYDTYDSIVRIGIIPEIILPYLLIFIIIVIFCIFLLFSFKVLRGIEINPYYEYQPDREKHSQPIIFR